MEFPKSHDLTTVIRYADCIKQLFQTSRRRLGPITLNSLLGFYDSGSSSSSNSSHQILPKTVDYLRGIKYLYFTLLLVVVLVEITLLTSILSGVTWTVAYSEF